MGCIISTLYTNIFDTCSNNKKINRLDKFRPKPINTKFTLPFF